MSLPNNNDDLFELIADLVLQNKGQISPSQIEGHLCGAICAGSRPSKLDINDAIDLLEPDLELNDLGIQTLLELCQRIENQLGGEALDYQPLVACSDYELAERLEAISQWCAHFISGFGFAISKFQTAENKVEFSKDIRESLQD